MPKHGKRYRANLDKVDREHAYQPAEAVAIIKDSQLPIFEKSSHSIRNDEPELLRETIVDFVGRGA